MFGLSFEKLFLVAIVAGLVIGPQRLPLYAHRLAELIRSFRTFVEHVTLRTLVAMLGDDSGAFLDRVTVASAQQYTLDYVRLELRGNRL